MRLQIENTASTYPLAGMPRTENDTLFLANDLDELLRRGTSAAQSGERDAARTLLIRAVAIDPENEEAWMWLASLSEYPEELLAFLDRVLSINPHNEKAVDWRRATRGLLAKTLVERAVAASADANYDLAEQCVERALDYDEENAGAWYCRAMMTEDDETRQGLMERVLELDSEHEGARNAIAEAEARQTQAILDDAKAAAHSGDGEKALELLTNYLDKVPESVEGWLLRSHLAISVDEKVEALERVVELDPANQAARSGLAYLALSFGTTSADVVEEETTAPESVGTVEPEPEAVEVEAFEPAEVSQPETEEVVFAEQAHEDDVTFSPSDEYDAQPPFDEPADSPEEHFMDARGEPAEEIFAAEVVTEGEPCPFCSHENDPLTFECGSCRSVLGLSDIERLFEPGHPDVETIQTAVTRMEAEWNLRDFDAAELTDLGIGHFMLGNKIGGMGYLQEAARLDPDNVILAGQVNALAIRAEEMRRQTEVNGSKPKGKTILVVDDSATVRKLIAGKLEKSGHLVVSASDGVEALERLEGPLPDLILLDITMPRMDGYEVCRQIRQNPVAKDLPIVMISGKDGFFDKVRGRMAGCTGYVTKPFGPETLMKALETYLLPEA